MKAFGLKWWLAACGLALLLATLEVSSRALDASIALSHEASDVEQVAPSAAPVLSR